jgi:26S proteasome regulatory subunit N9
MEQVEHLVMKALSLKLLKGYIDQTAQTVTVTWVQSRVLMQDQIRSMTDRLKAWNDNVHSTLLYLEGETPELFA